MDTTQYGESAYLTTELVKQSPTKRVYISGDAKVVMGKFGEKLELPVELDGKAKMWGLIRDHVKNLQQFGKDSKSWVGHWVELRTTVINNKEVIVAVPVLTKEEKV